MLHAILQPRTTMKIHEILPLVERIDRKVERLKLLLEMGGTLENDGASLHLAHLRMDVAGIADMNEPVWNEFHESILGYGIGPEREHADPEREQAA